MKIGLLMETAQSQQRLAGASLKQLKLQIQDLGGLVREEVRHTMVEELKGLAAATQSTADALQAVKRATHVRVVLWSLGITGLCGGLALGTAWWVLPSATEIAQLRAKRDALKVGLSLLEQQGGRVDLRRCGAAQRLCVRIDRKAPSFGSSGDYLILEGY